MRQELQKIAKFLKQNLCMTVLIGVIVFGVFLFLVRYSYAFFTISQEKNSTFHIVAGNFSYDLNGDKINDQNQVTIPANTTVSFELSIESKNTVSSEYILYYENELPSGVRVRYVTDSGVTSGVIGTSGNKENVMVVLENTTASSVTVTLGVKGGFTGKILALENGTSQVEEGYDFHKEYGYTGTVQTFTVPVSGYYRLEAWGAGGGRTHESTNGKGGYSKGTIYLERDEKLYFYIGKQYSYGDTTVEKVFNGGGWSERDTTGNNKGSYGGGATDIRLVSGEWDNSASLSSRILVAGGGGASEWNSAYGGNGGLIGTSGYGFQLNSSFNLTSTSTSTGGSQVSGGSVTGGSSTSTKGFSGSFGKGGFYAGPYDLGGGGGGGYYGGGTPIVAGGGGGGSSFISGYAGVNAITNESSTVATNQTLHYSGKYFLDGATYTGVSDSSGRILATYVGATFERKNTKLDEVRYIKDCVNGSSTNVSNHWIEIEALQKGINLALGKEVTGTAEANGSRDYSKIVDGSIDLDSYGATASSGLQCVTIDLGQISSLDEIGVWHYYGDYRKYNNHTLSVSSDQSNWVILINNRSGVPETENGYHFSAWQEGTDVTPPVLTLKGSSTMEIAKDTAYVEPGYTAIDDVDGDITTKVEVYGSVNFLKEGTYSLLYVARDTAGNVSSLTRTIVVYKNYTITNLVKNGSFENDFTNWTKIGTAAALDINTTYHPYGSKSYARYAVSTPGHTYIQQKLSLTQNHVYYMRLKGHTYGSSGSTASQTITFDFANHGGATAKVAPGAIALISARVAYNGTTTSVAFNVNYAVTTLATYVDGVAVIDLTAAFGSGNEPTKAWCDSHIDWFEGSATVKYTGS